MAEDTKILEFTNTALSSINVNVDADVYWTLSTTGPILLSQNYGQGPKEGINIYNLPFIRHANQVDKSITIHINGSEPCHGESSGMTLSLGDVQISSTTVTFTSKTHNQTIEWEVDKTNCTTTTPTINGWNTTNYTVTTSNTNITQIKFEYDNTKTYPCFASLEMCGQILNVEFFYTPPSDTPPTPPTICTLEVSPSEITVGPENNGVMFKVTSRKGLARIPYVVSASTYASRPSSFTDSSFSTKAITENTSFLFSSKCNSVICNVKVEATSATETKTCALTVSCCTPMLSVISSSGTQVVRGDECQTCDTLVFSSNTQNDVISSITSYTVSVKSTSNTLKDSQWSFQINDSIASYIKVLKNSYNDGLIVSVNSGKLPLPLMNTISGNITISNKCGLKQDVPCEIDSSFTTQATSTQEFTVILSGGVEYYYKTIIENENGEESVTSETLSISTSDIDYHQASSTCVVFSSLTETSQIQEVNNETMPSTTITSFMSLLSKNTSGSFAWGLKSSGNLFPYSVYWLQSTRTENTNTFYTFQSFPLNYPISTQDTSLLFFDEETFNGIKYKDVKASNFQDKEYPNVDKKDVVVFVYPSNVGLSNQFDNTVTFIQYSTQKELPVTFRHWKEAPIEEAISSITLTYDGYTEFTYGNAVDLTPMNMLKYSNMTWFGVDPEDIDIPIPFKVELSSITMSGDDCAAHNIHIVDACTISSTTQTNGSILPHMATELVTSISEENVQSTECSVECVYKILFGTVTTSTYEDKIVTYISYDNAEGKPWLINEDTSLTITLTSEDSNINYVLELSNDSINLKEGDNSNNPIYIAAFGQLNESICRLGLRLNVDYENKTFDVNDMSSVDGNQIVTSETTVHVSIQDDQIESHDVKYDMVIVPITSVPKDVYVTFNFIGSVDGVSLPDNVPFIGYKLCFKNVEPNASQYLKSSEINFKPLDANDQIIPSYENTDVTLVANQAALNDDYSISWTSVALGVNQNINWTSNNQTIELGCGSSFFNVCGIIAKEQISMGYNFLDIDYSLTPIDNDGVKFANSDFTKSLTPSNNAWMLQNNVEVNDEKFRSSELKCWVKDHTGVCFTIIITQQPNSFAKGVYEIDEFTVDNCVCGEYPNMSASGRIVESATCGPNNETIFTLTTNDIKDSVRFYGYEDGVDDHIEDIEADFIEYSSSRTIYAMLDWNGATAQTQFEQLSCEQEECRIVNCQFVPPNNAVVSFTSSTNFLTLYHTISTNRDDCNTDISYCLSSSHTKDDCFSSITVSNGNNCSVNNTFLPTSSITIYRDTDVDLLGGIHDSIKVYAYSPCTASISCNHTKDYMFSSMWHTTIFQPQMQWDGKFCSDKNTDIDIYISPTLDDADFVLSQTIRNKGAFVVQNTAMPYTPTTYIKFACHADNDVVTEVYSVTEFSPRPL